MDVVELLPRLYFLRFPVGHVYLWLDDDGITVVDTSFPGSAPAIAAAIEGLGHHRRDVRRLVLTHFHPDHVGSAADVAAWGDVTVHAHRADAPVIRGLADGPPPTLLDWERPIYADVTSRAPAGPPPVARVDVELGDGDVLDIGGPGGATVVSVPGHTDGSIALHLPGPGVLIAGDTIARTPRGEVILGVFNADPDRAAASLRRMAALDIEVACFGHGEPAARDASTELRAAAARLG